MKEEKKKIEKIVKSKEDETPKIEEKKSEKNKTENTKEKKKEVKEETKKEPITKTPKIKKTEAFARGVNIPVSTKQAVAVCRFIKNKKIGDAIRDLEQVKTGRKAVPMKGEIPHRKGMMMSGRFPKKATEHFIILLKSLAANANVNELEEPIITEAIANFASRPYGRFGRTQKKRTHIKIIAKNKIKKEINKIKWKKKM